MNNLHPLFEILATSPRELLEDSDTAKLAAIIRAYDRALLDPAARIPTYLHAAIEGARK